jgi:hypothetical protein
MRDALQRYVIMGPEEYARASRTAGRYAEARSSDPEVLELHRELFRSALATA